MSDNTSSERTALVSHEKQRPGDCISEAQMQEIARRLSVTLTQTGDGSVVYSVVPPPNKNAIWVPVNIEGERIAPNRRYDYTAGEWMDDIQEFQEFVSNPANVRNLMVYDDEEGWSAEAPYAELFTWGVTSNGDKTFELSEAPAGDYHVSVTPVGDPGTTRVFIREKGEAIVTMTATGHTAGTQTFEVAVMAMNRKEQA